MSVLKDKLLDTYNSSKLFYDNYISNSKIDELNKNFNKFRLYYLNLLSNVKIKFYNFLN